MKSNIVYKKISKMEIATYLKNYFEMIFSAVGQPNSNFYSLFSKNVQLNGTPQYCTFEHYENMILIYEFFLLSNYFGILNDSNQKDLEEKEILVSDVFEKIFVNKDDYKKFSKKQIIKYIRNAISHNDKDDRELYSLYRNYEDNNIWLEIELKKTKPIPFHVRMDLRDYVEIMMELTKSHHKSEISILVPSDVKFKNYIHKLDEIKIMYIDSVDKKQESIISVSELSEEQKQKLIQLVNMYPNKRRIDFCEFIRYCITNIIPLGMSKIEDIYNTLIVTDEYILDTDSSFYTVIRDLKKGTNKKDVRQLLSCTDIGKYIVLASIVYFRYMIDTVITTEQLCIGNNTYPRNKLRNSLTHGRWFFGLDGNLELYDSNKTTDFKFDYNWHSNIVLGDLITSIDKIYKNNLTKSNKKEYFHYPISFKLDTNTKELLHISFTKNDKLYIYNLNVNKRADGLLTWGLYIIENSNFRLVKDPLEAEIFFKELNHLSSEEKIKYSNIINILRHQYLNCLKYKAGLIPLKELNEKNYIVAEFNKKAKQKILKNL